MDDSAASEAWIPVRSHRQAMDWSLVLLSQGIECSILHDELGWRLRLETPDRARALAAIEQYRRENRGWAWRDRLSEAGADIHWGVILWCLGVAAMDAWIASGRDFWRSAGQMDSAAVHRGEWWRLFTAVWLHADIAHLMANLTAGFLTLGLAMTRWGAGWALLAAALAGGVGNLVGLAFHAEPHFGLGASGMVMGGLGLLTVLPRTPRRDSVLRKRRLLRSLLGGALLFVFLGLNPASDVAAHVGGFVGGIIFGFALSAMPARVLHSATGNCIVGVAGLAFLSLCWVLALR